MLVELIAKNAGQTQEGYRKYYPSPSKAGRCIRSLVYHAMDVSPDPFPDRAILVFDDGHWDEELIKDYIRKTAYTLDEWKGSKQRISVAMIDGKEMTGEVDGFVTDPLLVVYHLEIKSINHFGFQRLTDAPLEDHKDQCILYLHGLKRAGFDINKSIIIYKNKNTSAMKEFIVEYDKDRADLLIAKFEEVAYCAKIGKIPDRPYEYDSWQCEYCRWNKHCWSGYIDEVNSLSEDIQLSEEIETAARYYKELSAQETDIKKEKEELKLTLKKALIYVGAKSGRAGEYIISLSVSERDQIDKLLVPPEAIKHVPSERLTVKRWKGDKV